MYFADTIFGPPESANGKLLVWGPVVWIPGILIWRDCYLGESWLDPKPPTQTTNSALVEQKRWFLKILLMEEILHQLLGSFPYCLQGLIHAMGQLTEIFLPQAQS